MLKSRNTSQRTKHPPLGVDSTSRTRTWLTKLAITTEHSILSIIEALLDVESAEGRIRALSTMRPMIQANTTCSTYTVICICCSTAVRIKTIWATPWRVQASLNGTCLTQSRADCRHLVPCYTSPSYPDFMVVISPRSRGLAMPRKQISLAVDCVRPLIRPVQDQPSPPDMRLQAKILARIPSNVDDLHVL
jgi:hypothetical protein